MKKKVLLIVIPIILVIIIVAAVIIGVVLNKSDEEEESVGSKWGDTYYAYLREATTEKDLTDAEEKYGMALGMEDAKLQFCEVEENQDPTMIMTYKKNESSYVNVYQITENEKVTYVAYKQPTDIEYLYNIENNEYLWYIHTNGTNSDSYSSLKNIVNNLKGNSTKSEESNNVNIAELESDYTINKEEAEITQETVNGDKLTMLKFDAIFVKPEIEQNKQIEFNVDIKAKELKEGITAAVENYEKETKKLTDEIKEEVAKKVEEIKTKKEEISKAKEEVEKKKEEERIKAEEEAKGLQVGKYTLKYGTYKSNAGKMESGLYGTITLNVGGNFHIKSNYNESSGQKQTVIDCDGTYEVELNQPTGYPGSYADFIKFTPKSGEHFYFTVTANNTLTDQWHGYYFESGSSSQKQSSTNSTSSSTSGTSNSSSSNVASDVPNMANAISKEDALKLAQNKWGTNDSDTGNQIGYTYNGWIKDDKGMQYYVFSIKWLVDNSHWSFLSTVCISADGKTYKEIGAPTSYSNGQTVTQFDGEGNF